MWVKDRDSIDVVVIEDGLEQFSSEVTQADSSEEKLAIQGRSEVNQYSNNYANNSNNAGVTNHLAEVLASPYETPTYSGNTYEDERKDFLMNELILNTYMTAETGVIVVEAEYNRQETNGRRTDKNGNDKYLFGNEENGHYILNNVDLGLIERPKSQFEIDKSITNIKIILANGSTLFDVGKAGENVIWKDHNPYNIYGQSAVSKTARKYEYYYGTSNKNRYSYREEINKIVAGTDKGLIQITMDEELMHGSTIQITYKIDVTNIGEVDYKDLDFYYLAKENNTETNLVKTTPMQIIDYVQNNLQFDDKNPANQDWYVIPKDTLITNDEKTTLVNKHLQSEVNKFNTVIQTEQLGGRELQPLVYDTTDAGKEKATATKTLVLTQLITGQNSNKDLAYSNMVEIVKTKNTVGRRMAYSVVGNQDPSRPQGDEIDSSVADRVIILPPFGQIHIYYILIAVVAIILIGGITFIIKKVLA